MFNDVSYWKEEVPGTGICKPANTFSSMFNANSSDGQLEIEIAALANAFSVLAPGAVLLPHISVQRNLPRCPMVSPQDCRHFKKARSATKCLLLRATCPEWNGRKHFSRFASVAV